MTYRTRRAGAIKRVRAGQVLTLADHDRLRVDWRANAREAIDFARELRESHYDDPAQAERVRSGIGRLVRWADQRAGE